MGTHQRSILLGATSVVALLVAVIAPGMALAQSAAPPAQAAPPVTESAVEEIVVTGIRKSLENAVELKRTSDSIVDAISAEDIGAFPDQNIAESLQRVTGVQIQRDRGEGRDISIRGLDPKFAHVTLNGDGMMSISSITGLNPNGAQTPNRSFDFTTLSSDFVGALVVYKGSTADIEEGGLAGSVDVRTIRPLDLRSRKIAMTVEGYNNSYADKVGTHIVGMYADQFFDRKLGIVAGYDYSKRYMETQSYQSSGQDNRQENQLKAQGAANVYTNTGSVGASGNYVDWNGDGDNLDSYRFNHLTQFELDTGTRERKTFNLGLDWRPTDRFSMRFDSLVGSYTTSFLNAATTVQAHNGADPTVTGNRVVAAHISDIKPFAGDTVSSGTAGLTTCTSVGVSPATGCTVSVTTNLLTSGLIDYYDLKGAQVDNITKLHQSKTQSINYQLGGTYKFDHFIVEASGGFNQSKKKNLLNMGQDAFGYQEVIYDQRTDIGGIPTLAYGPGANVLNPSAYNSSSTFFGGFIAPQSVKNKFAAVDVTWRDTPFSWLTSVKAGYKYTKTQVNQTSQTLSVSAAKFATLSGDTLVANTAANGIKAGGITLTNYMTGYGGSDFLSRYNGDSIFPTTWVGPDVRSLLAKYPLSQLEALPGVLTTDLTKTWVVNEATDAAYLRADFSFLGGDLTGNVGVRYFNTKQSSGGYTGDLNSIYQINISTLAYQNTSGFVVDGNEYGTYLPSVNLRYNLSDDKVIRFATSRTVTRPDIGNLVPGNGAIAFTSQTATINNTKLKPYYSDNYDLSGEWYLPQGALLSAAVFYKYIRGYYVSTTSALNINYKDLNGVTQPLVLSARQSVNGSSTTTHGVEISYQQPFTMLPAPFDGLGAIFNYTRTIAGGIQTSPTSPFYPLPSVSRDAFNAVLYYEKNAVSTRLAYNWRSKFTESAGGVGGDARGGSYVKAAGYLDFSSKYQVDDRLAVTFDAVNLLDTAVERTNIYGFGRGYEVNGRTFTMGVRFALN